MDHPTDTLPPHVDTTAYLYGAANPTAKTAIDGDHAYVTVDRLTIVAWNPDVLRQFAAVCVEAADALEGAPVEVPAS